MIPTHRPHRCLFRRVVCALRKSLLVALFASGLATADARTAGAGSQEISLDRDQSIHFGRHLLAQGRADIAFALARALVEADAGDAEALILLAAALQAQGQDEAARAAAREAHRHATDDQQRFEAAMLAGRADYRRGAHTRAQWWVRRAAHAAPDAEARATAERNFAHVRRENPLELSFSFGLAGSSNINQGSSTDTVEVFGLPFQLDGAAQALSGTEFALDTGLRYRIAQTDRSATTLSAGLSARAYRLSSEARAQAPEARNSDYAFQSLEVGVSHRFTAGPGEAVHEIAGTVGRSWYGGAALSDFARIDLSRATALSPRTGLRFTLTAQRQERRDSAARSSTTLGVQTDVNHTFESGARLQATAALRETRAESTDVRHSAQRAQLTYVMAEPVAGVRLSSTLGLERRRYPAHMLAPEGRRDLRGRIGLSASFEEIEYMGFSPSLNLDIARTRSNVPIHERRSVDLFMGIASRF